MVLFSRLINSKVLLLAVPLMLAGCGGEPPDADGCYTEVMKASAKTKDIANDRAKPMIEKFKEKIEKKFKNGIKYHQPAISCVKFEKKKKVNEDPEIARQEAELAAQKEKEKAKSGRKNYRSNRLDCQIVVRYCPKPAPPKAKQDK